MATGKRGRANKAMMLKPGATKNRSRTLGCGGKVYKCGGKIKKCK